MLEKTFNLDDIEHTPIIDFSISMYDQYAFNNSSSEQELIIVKKTKDSIGDNRSFLYGVFLILQDNRREIQAEGDRTKELVQLINQIKEDLKYEIHVDTGSILDHAFISAEWNVKEILLESKTEFIYMKWSTFA